MPYASSSNILSAAAIELRYCSGERFHATPALLNIHEYTQIEAEGALSDHSLHEVSTKTIYNYI